MAARDPARDPSTASGPLQVAARNPGIDTSVPDARAFARVVVYIGGKPVDPLMARRSTLIAAAVAVRILTEAMGDAHSSPA